MLIQGEAQAQCPGSYPTYMKSSPCINWGFNSNPNADFAADTERTINVGEKVKWIWTSGAKHGITGNISAPKKYRPYSFERTFHYPGTYKYEDPSFPNMYGTITVNPCHTVASSTTNVLCHGGGEFHGGSATVVATGGTAPYTFRWDDVDQQTTATASNLPVGDYNCLVTDFNGCVATANVAISQPSLLTVVASSTTNNRCIHDGSATVVATGGTAPYTFDWYKSGGVGSRGTATASNLPVGDYNCLVTDSKGCVETAHVTISQPSLLTVVASSTTNVLCHGGGDGSATVVATGGTAPYSFHWYDSVGQQTTATASDLPVGDYNCLVTDSKGCVETAHVTISQPSLLVSAGADQRVCSGDSVTLSASGATTYAWDKAVTDGTAFTPTAAATYTVTGTDGNGCIGTDTVVVELLSSWLCSCVTALESNNCVKLRECYNTVPCGCGSLDTTCISYRTAYEAVHCCVTPRHSQIFF